MSFKAYEEYKDSGVEWLGEVPAHWAITPLKNKYAIFGGSTPSADEENWNGDIAWATPTDLNKLKKFKIKETTRKITRKGLDNCGATLVPKNSIIVSSRAPIGSIGITSKTLCTNQGCKSLVSGKSNEPRFHAYLLSIATKELNLRGKGTTFLEISGDVLGAFRITAPPFAEQTTIAAFLDHETARIDALIEEQQRLIALLKEKRQAVISHAVTKGLDPNVPMKDSGVEWLGEVPAHWEVLKLKQLCTVKGGSTPSKENPNFWDGDIPWVSPKDMKKDYISSSIDALTKDAVEKTGIPLIPPQSVLIVVRGMILAHSVPVAINSCDITINQDMKAMRPNQRILPAYFLTLIQGIKQSIFDYIDSSAHGTKKLEWDKFENILLPVPPISEQEINANKVLKKTNELDSLSSMSNRNIALLEERRSALISAAVTGKIDVRDWQPPKDNQTAAEPAEASA